MIRFEVPGEPVPKGRARVRIIRVNGKPMPQMYTPAETRAAEQAFLALARAHKPRRPLEGPLRVDFIFVVTPPQSMPGMRSKKWPHVKPDADNYAKLALDAMNGVFWFDDGQVCSVRATKIYGRDPRTEVEIEQLSDASPDQFKLALPEVR